MSGKRFAPCPFCGSTEVEMRGDFRYICCSSCGATGPTRDFGLEARSAWNAAGSTEVRSLREVVWYLTTGRGGLSREAEEARLRAIETQGGKRPLA